MSEVLGVVGATGGRGISRHIISERASQRAFFGVSALLFAARAGVAQVRTGTTADGNYYDGSKPRTREEIVAAFKCNDTARWSRAVPS